MQETQRAVTFWLLLTIGCPVLCLRAPVHRSAATPVNPEAGGSSSQAPSTPAPLNCPRLGALGAETGRTEPGSDVRRLWVSVTDRKGDPVVDLSAKNFHIFENKREQEVMNVSLPVDPLAVVLLLEFSRPIAHLYDEVSPALEFVKQLGSDDCAAVIAFGEKSEVRTDFTRDPSRLRSALESLQHPSREEVDLFGSLDDVLSRLQNLSGRKVVVLIGSGLDSQKRKSLDAVLRRLQDTETVVYAIGKGEFAKKMFENREVFSQEETLKLLQAENTLKSLSRRTGGKAFFPFAHSSNAELVAEIRADLQSQYQLTYRPRGKAGQFRKIQVQLADSAGTELRDLKIRTQDGYFASR